ncbi:aspartyl/glutamyl-tRNA amidotransferase A subunit [Candidatus Carsonella ruddii CS isolate Thao2000]|uniref:Aspartyl/glutamyl-tRNA amidotransferase A subunit n=1 Tax=Candidatus Carsonella ruddii CS isolate Thao2000 TaxID=1202537 RepID=J7GYN9_CARRU|nr:amidase family protein [Candidatus Carsonella ruddii]AFP83713.1 aspartyl/glutamyl-tRNA amidotransferase A subunit [Candidatus Carsonella ruddii CS isolate Thao2000]
MNNIFKIKLKKIILLLKNKKISNFELIKQCFFNLKNNNKFYTELYEKESFKYALKLDNSKKKEISLPITLKDIYTIKNKFCKCNSNILNNKLFNYDSKIVKIFKKNKINIIGKVILEEFCVGETGKNNFNLSNLFKKKYFIGGSSNGSSLSLNYNFNNISIGSDTGGSIRTPAAFCNLVGFKPSYGKISREGMIPYSTYLDTCSIMSNYVEDCKIIFNLLNKNNFDLSSNNKKIFFNIKSKYISILYIEEMYVDYEIKFIFEKIIKNFEEMNFKIIFINLKNINFFLNFYDFKSSKDFYSNTSKYDGIKFKKKKYYKNINDLIKTNRIFLNNCKNKILLGSNYFFLNNDLNINILYKDFLKIFEFSNLILLPTNIIKNLKIINKFSSYFDYLTIISNLLKLPSINLSLGFINHLPLGFQLISEYNNDNYLLNIAILYEKKFLNKYVL